MQKNKEVVHQDWDKEEEAFLAAMLNEIFKQNGTVVACNYCSGAC